MSAPRWLIGLAAVTASIPVLVGGGWATYRAADHANRVIGGKAGENVAAAIGVVGLCLTIVAVTAVAIWPDRLPWFDGRRRDRRDWERRLARDLAALGRDRQLSRWLPLATRLQTAYPPLIQQWERRYQQLLADPKRRHWAERALAGEQPADLEIDYREDPALLLTCAHLQPIERALRAADPRLKPVYGFPLAVISELRIDGPAALASFGAPEGVVWQEPDDHPRDPDPGQLRCARCRSAIMSGFQRRFP